MQRSESAATPVLSTVVSIVLVVIGIVVIGAGAVLAPGRFFPSYLAAFLYWAEIALGCLGVLLVALLIRSRWGAAVQRPAIAGAFTLIVLAVLFLPLLLGLDQLYPWTASDYPEQADLPTGGIRYLSLGFWIGRSVVAFAIWIGLTFWISRALNSYDRDGDAKFYRRAKHAAALGAVLFVVTGVFIAATDWSMSLDPYWFSSIYGWLGVARQAMVGLAFIIVTLTIFSRREQVARIVNQRVINDLAMLQLGTIMVWAYMHFFQYLIMWHGNLPKEARWFAPRTTGGWEYFAIFLIVFNLALPLIVLLVPVPKKTLGYVSIASVLVLVSHWVESTWLVLPASSPTLTISWLDIALPLAVGAIWIAAYAWFQGRQGFGPEHHPVLDELEEEGLQPGGDMQTPTPVSG